MCVDALGLTVIFFWFFFFVLFCFVLFCFVLFCFVLGGGGYHLNSTMLHK